jgi:hypothetical protein
LIHGRAAHPSLVAATRRADPGLIKPAQPGANQMSSSAPVAALVFVGPIVVTFGIFTGHVELIALGIAALFGAGLIGALDGRKAA